MRLFILFVLIALSPLGAMTVNTSDLMSRMLSRDSTVRMAAQEEIRTKFKSFDNKEEVATALRTQLDKELRNSNNSWVVVFCTSISDTGDSGSVPLLVEFMSYNTHSTVAWDLPINPDQYPCSAALYAIGDAAVSPVLRKVAGSIDKEVLTVGGTLLGFLRDSSPEAFVDSYINEGDGKVRALAESQIVGAKSREKYRELIAKRIKLGGNIEALRLLLNKLQ